MASVLVSTLPPYDGGVPAKTRLLCRHLRDLGHSVTVAWYATLSHEPALAGRLGNLLRGRRPGTAERTCFGDFPGHVLGCPLPELEAPYHYPNAAWRRLIAAHDRHIAVGGTLMASYPFVATAIPHLTWCATTIAGDRADRQRAMPFPRRLLDRRIVMPWLQRLERRAIRGCGHLLPVSGYAERAYAAMGRPARGMTRLPIPTDMALYHPPSDPAPAGVIGFAGRAGDPRKNVAMLVEALAMLVARGLEPKLRVTGPPLSPLVARAERLGVADRLSFAGDLPAEDLPAFYRGLDVFALPSFEEGFAIVGIEALASGVPVVSTRCGGPEDYVRPGENGQLTPPGDAGAMADALERLIRDRDARARMGRAARLGVADRFGPERFAADLAAAWARVWGERP